MFERAFQGAPSLEVLSPQGANPIALWKVVGGVQKVYDKALRGYVYQLVNNGAQTMIMLPKGEQVKQGLGLVQPVLVLQIFLPQNRDKPFSLEVGITDGTRSRRRLLFSAACHEAQNASPHPNALHARVSLAGLRRGAWLNLCLDVETLVRSSFKQAMKSVDSIAVHAECRLRRIFTMRSQPLQSETLIGCPAEANAEHEYEQPPVPPAAPPSGRLEPIPRSYEFPAGVDQHTQLITSEQVARLSEELERSKEERLYSSASPDTAHAGANGLDAQLAQDTSRLPDDESEDFGTATACNSPDGLGVPKCRHSRDGGSQVSLEPLATGAARATTPVPVGYEEMIRRAGDTANDRDQRKQSRGTLVTDATQEPRSASHGGVGSPEAVAERPEGCTLPEAMGSARQGQGAGARRSTLASTDKSGKGGSAPRSAGRDAPSKSSSATTTAPSLQAVCLGATAPRRKAQRRPGELSGVQARNPGERSGCRFPASAREAGERSGGLRAMDRSPSNPRARPSRPLPLELGGPRSARDDGTSSAPCSGGSSGGGAVPSSARRGRRPGRLPAAQQTAGGDDSISPTSSAATRRRRELAKQTLHKTAEIYGVHKHTTLPKGMEHPRSPDENRTCNARADEDDADSTGLASPPGCGTLPEVSRSIRYFASPLGESPQQARDFEDDVGEPPPAFGSTLEALPECSGTPPSDVSAVLQAALSYAPRESGASGSLPPFSQERRRRPMLAEAEPHSRSQSLLPSALEMPDNGLHTPASSASLASPSRVLGARAEAADEIVFDEACSSPGASFGGVPISEMPLAPSLPSSAREPARSAGPAGAAGSAGGAGGSGPSLASGGAAEVPADAWSAFGSTVRHNQNCWPQSARFHGGSRSSELGCLPEQPAARRNASQEADLRRCSVLEWSEASSGVAPYDPPERRSQGDSLLDSGPIDGCSGFNGGTSFGDGAGDTAQGPFFREDIRRIKSLSPPRRSTRTRPHPIDGLAEPEDQLGPPEPSAPSSAPTEHTHGTARHAPAPFTHHNEPSVHARAGVVGSGGNDVVEEDGAFSLDLFQRRPFTPPVVPVGKLLRGMYESTRNAGARLEEEPTSPPGSSEEPPGNIGVAHGVGLLKTPGVRDVKLEGQETWAPDAGGGTRPLEPALPSVEAPRQMMEAIYDPVLDVFYDPTSDQYYERRREDPAEKSRVPDKSLGPSGVLPEQALKA